MNAYYYTKFYLFHFMRNLGLDMNSFALFADDNVN